MSANVHRASAGNGLAQVGLVLPGGGARNAYQAGVLRAIAELLPDAIRNPFPIICGTSAGAINAALLACHAQRFQTGVQHLSDLWSHLQPDKIYRTDLKTAARDAARWFAMLASAGLSVKPRALLDNAPLRALLESHLRLARVRQNIANGSLKALAVTACGYQSGRSITYFAADETLAPWHRSRRLGIPCDIDIDHIMASTALPLIFPAVYLNNEYQGDGSMRETAPLSPALHLGADRLLVVTVRNPTPRPLPAAGSRPPYPSFGQIGGYVLDTLFMDSLNADIERLIRINQLVAHHATADSDLRPIELLVLSPSRDLRDLVPGHLAKVPRSVRFLLNVLGADTPDGQPLVTYLLFESTFCKELIALGYEDGLRRRTELRAFILDR